ncbi:hypothetical protein HGRIS_005521 [Hohenbuehelia grisea]|uniref:Uncharacterized protein n=1 Tax=Hohenbuehelia grisea TaxID=104357 RepID=A0ABR3JY52_9AGAR
MGHDFLKETVYIRLAATETVEETIIGTDALAASGKANFAHVAALIRQLTDLLTIANTQASELNKNPRPGKPGPSKDELAKVIAEIIIAAILISKLLHDLELAIAGISKLVAILLVDAVVLLKSLALSPTLDVLNSYGG